MLLNSINPLFNLQRFTFAEPEESTKTRDSDNALNTPEVLKPDSGDQTKVVQALEKSLQAEGLTLDGLQEDDFTPENVAEQILGSVRKAYGALQQSDAEVSEDDFFSQIKAGIEKGFSEAKEMLDSLGVLQGKVAEDINKTFDLTLAGLSKIQSGESEQTTAVSLHSLSKEFSRSAEIQVETQEGDLVTISFNQSFSKRHTALQAENEDGRFMGMRSRMSHSREFSVTVEGELDKDEQKAIEQLMKKMRKVSHEFFKGDTMAAFKHAQKMGIDSEQIAGFSMDLNMHKSMQAVAAYQQIASDEASEGDSSIQTLTGFLEQANTMLADARKALQMLEEPEKSFNNVFKQLASLENDEHTEPSANQASQQMFADLVGALGKKAFV